MASRILVIDDSSDLRGMLKIFLELEGYSVSLARDGVEALRALQDGPFPCLILLDMLMDRMSGAEFLDRLADERPEIAENVPVVAMSALNAWPEDKVAAFLPKPFDIDRLIDTVKECCGKLPTHVEAARI